MNEFARHAAATGCDLLTTDERLDLALNRPEHPLALSQRVARAVTQNRIRQSMSELAHLNIDNTHRWLSEVAKDSPAEAVRLFIELAKFSVAQLKETSVTVTQNDQRKTYTTEELERIVSEQ